MPSDQGVKKITNYAMIFSGNLVIRQLCGKQTELCKQISFEAQDKIDNTAFRITEQQ